MTTSYPILPNQRQLCLAARGNLKWWEIVAVIGYNKSAWYDWEVERRGINPAILENFRAAAKRRFPHYRSDLAL